MDDISNTLQRLRVTSPSAHRERRFSDAGEGSSVRPNLVAVSQIHSGGSVSPESEAEEPQEPPPSIPLEQHVCSAEACAVSKVFETTELLEIILKFLDTDNVLALRRTSSKWNAVTKKSPTLRLHFFVHPRWDLHPQNFELLDLKIPGLSIERGDPLDMGHWVLIKMNTAAARRICPTWRSRRRLRSRSIYEGLRGGLGTRAERQEDDPWPAPKPTRKVKSGATAAKHKELFVVEPPVLGMQAFIIEPEDASKPHVQDDPDDCGPSACAKLHCDAGIKLGFLADTTLSLLSDHQGLTETEERAVLFKAIISFASPTKGPRKRTTTKSVTRIS